MKRSLGLHCSILRINTVDTGKDTPLERSSWISAGEELASLDNVGELPKVSPSDKESLQKFTRDLVTQSIVPHMERCISMWNDQVDILRLLLTSDRILSSRSRR